MHGARAGEKGKLPSGQTSLMFTLIDPGSPETSKQSPHTVDSFWGEGGVGVWECFYYNFFLLNTRGIHALVYGKNLFF